MTWFSAFNNESISKVKMENTEMTHEESLNLIKGMIQSAQNKMQDNSIHYLLWGWLVSVASIVHFTLIQVNFQSPWLVWPVIMPIGGIAAGIVGHRQGKKASVKTYTDRLMSFVWGGMVICMLILLSQGAHLEWGVVYPILMILWGWALFISGGMVRFKPLMFGGALNWILGTIGFYVTFENQLLLIAASMVFSYLVPGYMLRAKARVNAA